MLRLKHLVTAALLLAQAKCSPASDAAAASPSVTVPNGVIVGTTTKMAGATAAVSKYVGIPFAASPPLRFGPPEPAPSWTKPLMATTTKPACIQQFNYPAGMRDRIMSTFNNPGEAPPAESEDCMYLNVYVPPGTKRGDKKSVMFWLFGGNLQFGTGGLDFYDGTSFALNQDVIIVSPNYRTNVFGFPGSPQLKAPNQNPGFLDQRFGLQWVQDNIEHFGGDKSKVTIFGESAGGYSVKQLVAQPPSPLPFRGAIMHSEAALNEGNGTLSFEVLALGLGCGKAASQLKCMRSKPGKDIKNFIEHHALGFFPMTDGTTQSTDVRPAFNGGSAAKVPFMIGTNQDEGRVFAYILGFETVPGETALNNLFKTLFPNQPLIQQALKRILAGNVGYREVSTVLTQFAFLCPASKLARLAHNRGYSVHRYLFNASFPNAALFPDPGVYHTTEIPEVWGTYTRKGATKQQVQLSKYMQTEWANFAKNPTAGPKGGWPELSAVGNVQNLGGDGINGGKTIKATSIDQSCALFEPILDIIGI